MTSLHLLGRGAATAMVAGVAVALTSCSSGPATPSGSSGVSPDTRLKEAGATVLRQIAAYQQ